MTLANNRMKFEKFSIKIGIIFSKFGLSPNTWTLLTIIPTIIAFYFLINEQFLLTGIFFIIAAFIDMIDGSVARVMGKVTKLGAYLDTIIDRYVEGIIVFGLLFASLPAFVIPGIEFSMPIYAWIFLYFFGAFMITYAKSAAKEKELVEKELSGRAIQRAERMIILFIGLMLAAYDPLLLTYIIAVFAVIYNFSAIHAMRIAAKHR